MVVVVISILLAIKDFIPNVIAGLVIHLSDHIRVGDKVTVNDIEGKVMAVNALETRLETKRGDTIYVPNSILTKTVVKKKRGRRKRKKS